MLQLNEAIQHVMRHARPLEQAADVLIEDAFGMVLAEEIHSDLDMPPFDKAVMDGFAVRAEDVSNAPTVLNIIGEARAGSHFTGTINKKQAVRIMTGAPVPLGADAVVRIEDTEPVTDDQVRILTNAPAGNFITPRGEHTKTGAVVLKRGTLVRSPEIAILATVGRERIKVYRNPTVAIVTTGDELVEANATPSDDQIRDANTPLLNSLLRRDGIQANILGIVKDDNELLSRAISAGLGSDILLISGGVSAGKYDMIPEILAQNGVEKIFHKVNIKPGKPTFFGKTDKTLVFGMPGNPISTFTAYTLFVAPALKKIIGHTGNALPKGSGLLTKNYNKTDPRLELLQVKIEHKNNTIELTHIATKGSADVFSMSQANAFALIDKAKTDAGDIVEFIRW